MMCAAAKRSHFLSTNVHKLGLLQLHSSPCSCSSLHYECVGRVAAAAQRESASAQQ